MKRQRWVGIEGKDGAAKSRKGVGRSGVVTLLRDAGRASEPASARARSYRRSEGLTETNLFQNDVADSERRAVDWAPFVEIPDAERRDLARRHFLLNMTRMLAELARDDGLAQAAAEIEELSLRLRPILLDVGLDLGRCAADG